MKKNWTRYTRTVGALAIALLGSPLPVQAAPIVYDLAFETSGQSIWDTGTSYTLDETKFIGAAWKDKKVDIDLMVGDESTNLPNPALGIYNALLKACRSLGNSESVCINGQTGQVGVPALGSRPGVRSCGRFAVACQAARLVDISVRAAYDTAFKACDAAFPASVCRNGQSLKLPVIALGTAPASYLNVDTRTGVAVNGTVDGRVGLELGVKIDSGSVDAKVSYQAKLDLPNTAGSDKTIAINFNPESAFAGTNTLNTTFATLSASVNAVMELSGSVSAEGCLIGPGCESAGDPFKIVETAPILSFNADGEGGILLLGHPPSLFGYPPKADGFPFTMNVLEPTGTPLATITLHLPQPNASGGLDVPSQKLKASDQDDLLDLFLDVDNIVATAASAPGLFGRSFDIPVIDGSIGFDIIDVQMGPTIDLKQEFELDPTLFVSLAFDKAVKVGDLVTKVLVSAWDQLPSITFLDDVTTVTPTFFVQANLQNRTLLDFDLEFVIDLLQITYDFGPLFGPQGKGILGVGNILDEAIDLFDSPDLYTNLFPLAGFNLQIGKSFEVNFLSGSTGPTDTVAFSAFNEIVLPGDVSAVIPVPSTIMLLLAGLCGVYSMRWQARRRGGARVAIHTSMRTASAA